MTTAQYVLTDRFTYEETIKKSRFLVHTQPISSVEEALQVIHRHSDLQATHNCWAFRVGQLYRFFDDGEPGGTAGRPILQAIEAAQCNHLVVLVTRWYGGVKLGTGGLARAYGGTAAKALHLAPKKILEHRDAYQLACGFTEAARVKDYLQRSDVHIVEEQYHANGVQWKVAIRPADVAQVMEKTQLFCRGQSTWTLIEQ